ncbi:HMA2 domain-containing protein [Anaerobiospirillum succiniciproducens]|uniref:HMA2 domain-containing protein n=1 Tax=Anaerobiospirillum succiniciproducens TaxID=13335 RepID=UPI00048573FA|nr:hypothetical protein [Anaerobiospirillum succiniciproducens]
MSLLKSLIPAKTKANYIVSQVEVASLIPGRLRVICKALKTDADLRRQVEEQLKSVGAISSYKINDITGSVLIHYETEKVSKDKFLTELLLLAHEKLHKARA